MPEPAKKTARGGIAFGWAAAGFSYLVSVLWAIWGSIEAFHEGWWEPALPMRLLQTVMYLTPMLICLVFSLVGIRWPKAGAALYFFFGLLFTIFTFKERWTNLTWETVVSWLPVTGLLLVIAGFYWFATIKHRKLMLWLALGLPLLTAICCGAEGAWRVSGRIDDGIRTERLIEGNGVSLVWAPQGPGWVLHAPDAADWDTATEICAHLSADGLTVMDEPQNIWRLPTVEEAVASMARHGKNSGGVWDAETKQAKYDVKPDKESPLWVPYTEVIYWWTATEIDDGRVYMIVYDGKVWPKRKGRRMGYQGFRAVREP